MDKTQITIIGAGVVGLAVAAELSRKYEVIVLERNDSYGRETSSRNSEVVHAGLYYPPGTLKARLCVRGAGLLYAFCAKHGVPHKRTGKLVVAADEAEAPRLTALKENAEANGAAGLNLIDAREVARLEPAVKAAAALYSPDTGIVDSHALMARLHRIAEANGALFSFGSECVSIEKTADGYVVGIKGEDYTFLSDMVINSAGLSADKVAEMAGVDVDAAGYRLALCKGSYFSYAGPAPVGRLVYPLPHDGLTGLGVHATLDLAGRLRFGPDVEFVAHVDYTVEASRGDTFYEGACRIIRGLRREAFVPDMAGVRPKLAGGGFLDFIIRREADRGLPGLINLVGIESPGLTAALAVAEMVGGIAGEVL